MSAGRLHARFLRPVLGTLLALLIAWAVLPTFAGVSHAVVDGLRGHRELKRYGELMPGTDTYHRLMRERYGVTVSEAGCTISDVSMRYRDAYSWYANRRLMARYRRDVSTECASIAAAEVAEPSALDGDFEPSSTD